MSASVPARPINRVDLADAVNDARGRLRVVAAALEGIGLGMTGVAGPLGELVGEIEDGLRTVSETLCPPEPEGQPGKASD